MCQWRTWCLEHHTQVLGVYLWQDLPVDHCFSSCSRGVPKQYSKPKLSWHFNDLGIPSTLKKTRISICAQRSMHVFLHVALMFYYFYTDIMIFSGGKKGFLKHKFIPCSVFHKMNFLPPSLQNTITQLLLQITAIIQISRTQVYSGKPGLELKTWRIHDKAVPYILNTVGSKP